MRNPGSLNKRQRNARARTMLSWGLLVFFGMAGAFTIVAGSISTELRDPEYNAKLSKLRERVTENPDRPLIVILGSSRSAAGMRPDVWQNLSPQEPSPIVFNFAITGAGPRQHLIVLRRILAQGIRPAGVLVEVLPAFLYQADSLGEEASLKCRHMLADELAIYGHSPPAPPPVRPPPVRQPPVRRRFWYSKWLDQWYSSRIRVVRHYAPGWVAGEPLHQERWKKLDAWGWSPFASGAKAATADEYRRGVALSRREYEPRLAHWEVSDVADQAVQELLKTCQRERMSAVLYLMPEGSPFRELYRPSVRTELESYLTRVCHDHDATLLDATLWNTDEDFWDGHHLLVDGATRFSQRLGRELLDPFVAKLRRSHDLSQRPVPERH